MKPSAAEEVKVRLNIEDVVGGYVQLKRAGRNFKALSPWTNEKTPSFIVSPEKQIWHDFSSGKGGDIFGFVMEMEGLDFVGALNHLARQAGVDLDQYKTGQTRTNTKLKSRAAEALELATKFYQKQLSVNVSALKYLLKERGLNKKTVLTWRLGYSPTTGSALTSFLTKRGFSTDEMKRAGLVAVRPGGTRDMFRGRIIIPLTDQAGSVVGFTARLLANEPNAPKYINTPATILYDKSRQVFGLHLAKTAIRKSGYVVVVEGNMDVIACHQAGFDNVVASAGTAMTEHHLKILKRFTGDIRLCFDADSAGIGATERIIPLAQKVGVSPKIITISGAKDPDELVNKNPKAWDKAVESAVYAPDWLIKLYSSELDLSAADGKKAFTDALVGVVRALADPVEREHYLKKIAEVTDTSLEAVQAKFNRTSESQPLFKKPKMPAGNIDVVEVEYQRLQDHFLAIMLAQPKLRWLLKHVKKGYFTDDSRQKLLEFLVDNPDFAGDKKTATKLRDISDYVKILSLQFEELYAELNFSDLEEQSTQLVHRLISRYITIQKQKLAEQMRETSDDKKLKKLIKKVDTLNQLMKQEI